MSHQHRSTAHSAPPVGDAETLQRLGVKPVLHRRMSGQANGWATFTVMSITSGSQVLFGFGLHTGGPGLMVWGFLAGGLLILALAAALSEITSAYPTSGALYDMANRLGGRLWGFVTGYLNLLGLIGGIAGIDFGCAQFIAAYLNLQWGITLTAQGLLALCGALMLTHALLNLFGVRVMAAINSLNGWLQLACVAGIVCTLTFVPSRHQSVGFVLGHYTNTTGWTSAIVVAGIGLLFSMYSLAGFDTSAHLSEETTGAALAAPRAIMRAVLMSVICGLVLIVAMLFAIQDYTAVLASPLAPAEIFAQAIGAASTNVLLLAIIGSQFFAGYALVGACSRMCFAFSRDGAVPYSHLWRKVRKSNSVPANAVWLVVTIAFLLVVPTLKSTVVFTAVTTIAVIGTVPAYAIPVLLRRWYPHRFTPGPWTLGRWSAPIGSLAVLGVAAVTVLLCLPQARPVTWTNANYSGPVLLAVLALAWMRWRVAGRDYQPPTTNTSAADLDFAEGTV